MQFALNLEYLEAEFYSITTTGKKLEERGFEIWGVGEPATPGRTKTRFGAVHFTDEVFKTNKIAQDIANDEIAHVRVLWKALENNGVNPIAKPAINLDALAAMGASLENERTFLTLSRVV